MCSQGSTQSAFFGRCLSGYAQLSIVTGHSVTETTGNFPGKSTCTIDLFCLSDLFSHCRPRDNKWYEPSVPASYADVLRLATRSSPRGEERVTILKPPRGRLHLSRMTDFLETSLSLLSASWTESLINHKIQS